MNYLNIAGNIGKHPQVFNGDKATKYMFSIGVDYAPHKATFIPIELFASTQKAVNYFNGKIKQGTTIDIDGHFNHEYYTNKQGQGVNNNDVSARQIRFPNGNFSSNVAVVHGNLARDAHVFTVNNQYKLVGTIISNDGQSRQGKPLSSAVPFEVWTQNKNQANFWKNNAKQGVYVNGTGHFNRDVYQNQNKQWVNQSDVQMPTGAFELGYPKNSNSNQNNNPQNQNNPQGTAQNPNNMGGSQNNGNMNNNNGNQNAPQGGNAPQNPNNQQGNAPQGTNGNNGNNNPQGNNPQDNGNNGNGSNGNGNQPNQPDNPLGGSGNKKIDISDDDLPF